MLLEELIEGCLKGKGSHFTLLYKTYSSTLYSICLRYAGDKDEAKDLMQEGFVRVFQNLKNFDKKKGQFEGWLKRIFINLCIDSYRKKHRFSLSIPVENIAEEISEENEIQSVLDDLTYPDLIETINKLPAGYRTIFNMYVIDGRSHKEISSELHISENTSKTQLHKARNLLRKNIMEKLVPVQNRTNGRV